MRHFLTISLLVALAACSRKTIPTVTVTQVTDSSTTRVEYRDSVITIPGERITIYDTISLSGTSESGNAGALSYSREVKGSHATLKVDLSGNHLAVECNVDSLEQVIRGLNEKVTNTRSIVIEKPVEVKVPAPYIPRWIWYTMGILAGLVIVTNLKSIVKLAKIILAFG